MPASYDEWTEQIKCPKCGNTGSVIWCEDERRFPNRDPHRSGVPSVGFKIIKLGASSTSLTAYCDACDVEANLIRPGFDK